MWLLNTEHIELTYFQSPEAVPGPYAILSHVWNTEEQSFQDILSLPILAEEKGLHPQDLACSKIKRCCELSQSHGYQWVWIDTCCINKTSSAEMSEDINSMFHYYSVADVCYAYLDDVPHDEAERAFDHSAWHKRGWTLQELIAPSFLVFYSREWELIGTKADLASRLEIVTRIPATVLTLEQDFRDTSVSARMSWAAGRQTTREEDRAYSLLGIFDINMHTIYGEGPKAFQRLQEEIMKHYADTTLFAWTTSPKPIRLTIDDFELEHTLEHSHSMNSYLFAPDPDAFHLTGNLRVPVCVEALDHTQTTLDLPTFTTTPYGILAHVPTIELAHGSLVIAFSWRTEDSSKELGLILLACPLTKPNSPNLKYCIHGSHRLVQMQHYDGKMRGANWKNIYLIYRPSLRVLALRNPSSYMPEGVKLSASFRFGRIDKLLREHSSFRLVSSDQKQCKDAGSPVVTLLLAWVDERNMSNESLYIALCLGTCGKCPRTTTTERGSAAHWATVRCITSSVTLPSDQLSHSCDSDHVKDWPLWTKLYSFSQRLDDGFNMDVKFRLAFSPCPFNELDTLLVHILPQSNPFQDARKAYEEIYQEIRLYTRILDHMGGMQNQQYLICHNRRDVGFQMSTIIRELAARTISIKWNIADESLHGRKRTESEAGLFKSVRRTQMNDLETALGTLEQLLSPVINQCTESSGVQSQANTETTSAEPEGHIKCMAAPASHSMQASAISGGHSLLGVHERGDESGFESSGGVVTKRGFRGSRLQKLSRTILPVLLRRK